MSGVINAEQENYSKTVLGFWIYLLSDFLMFGALFATYAVLQRSTFGGPGPKELFSLPFTLIQTLCLLLSSFTAGLAGVSAHRKQKNHTLLFLGLTFFLGTLFLNMEWKELSHLFQAGHSWEKSAFLSAFFTLIGTHGVHVALGLLWILIFFIPICLQGITPVSIRRVTCLRIFWQFVNVVWIFIFSFVYLLGVA